MNSATLDKQAGPPATTPAFLQFVERNAIAIVIFALLIFYGYTTAIWLSIDHRPPRSDESSYFIISLYSYRMLQAFDPVAALNLKTMSTTKPGMVQFLSALSYFIVGTNEHTAIFLVNVGSVLLISFSLLWASRLLYRTIAPGLAATFWALSLNCLIIWSGYYQIDLPLAAAATFTMALCVHAVRTGYTHRLSALALLVTIAIGLPIKHMYAAYGAPPVALLMGFILFSGENSFRQRIKERRFLISCIAIGTILGLAYHALNYHIVAEQVHRAFHPPDQGPINYAHSILKLFLELLPNYMPLHLILFTTGCIFGAYYCRSLILFPLSLIVGGWCGVSISTQQPWSYYLFPLLPAFGLICASVFAIYKVLPEDRQRYARPVFAAAAICLSLFLAGVYLQRRMGTANPIRLAKAASLLRQPSSAITTNPMVDVNYWSSGYVDGNAALLPYPDDWKINEIAARIASVIKYRKTPTRVALLARWEYMSDYNVDYALYRAHLDKMIPMQATPLQVIKKPADVFDLGDILIFKEPNPFSGGEALNTWAPQDEQCFLQLLADDGKLLKAAGYEQVGTFSLPDHSSAYLWYRSGRGNDTLLNALDSAHITPKPGNVEIWDMNVGGQARRALFEQTVPPPAAETIDWPVHLRPGAKIKFGIGMSQDVWDPRKGDGVQFQVYLVTEKGKQQLFSEYLDPKNNPADRHWFDYTLPLNVSREEDAQIQLVTLPGSKGDILFDHAGWSDPKIVY